MKKIMPHIAAVFFSLFGAGVIILLMSYTFQALAYIFPDNFTAQVMGMILFDVAAIAWVGAFIYLCKSTMQYVFAFLGFGFGLLGTLGMVSIDVMLGGQQMIAPPVWVNDALIYGFIIAAVVHVILFYSYKLAAPEVSTEIALGIEIANITDEAMKQAEAVLLAQRGALGGVIAPRLVDEVRRNLGLPVSGDVLDLPAYDIPVQTLAHKLSFAERLKTAAQVLTNSTNIQQTDSKMPAEEKPVELHPIPEPILQNSNGNGHHPSPQ